MEAIKVFRRWEVYLLLAFSVVMLGNTGYFPENNTAKPTLVDGYMDKFGYCPGDSASVYINASENFKLQLRLLSFGNTAVDTVEVNVDKQSAKGSKPYANGFGYRVSFRYKVPKLKSGIYTWENSRIFFIVKEPSRKADIVVLYPYNTSQAYCAAGGKCFYGKFSTDKQASPRLSFLRPLTSPAEANFTEGFNRWIMNTKYNYRYISDVDMEDYHELERSKILVVIGHSEYWTRKARENFDRFVGSGRDAVILSGNTMWYQVRYNKEKTQIICYKTAHDSVSDPLLVTTSWDQASLHYPVTKSIGCEFSGYGLKPDKGWNGYKIAAAASPLLEGTKLKRGDILPCVSQEIDAAPVKEWDTEGFPVIDAHAMKARKAEIIGFDWGSRGDKAALHTFFVFQRTRRSGRIINVGSTNWCTSVSFANSSIRTITENMFNLLLERKNIFSTAKKTGTAS